MQHLDFRKFLSLILFSAFSSTIFAQVDHWETAVYASDEWKYQEGNMAFPTDWYLPDFDDSAWSFGNGGFGYSDGDDETILPQTLAVALRKEFEITDISKIKSFILNADYDDGFVAYLNGEEFARANIDGQIGVPPAYNAGTNTDREARLYQGEQPEYYFSEDIENYLQEGTNVLAVQVNNVSFNSSDLSALFFLSFGITNTSNEYGTPPSWFEAPFEFISSDLPIFVINTNGQEIVNDPRIAADLGVIHNGFGAINNISDPFNEYDGQISIEIRGASSQFLFPKKSFSFETQNADSTNNNVSLLGMPEENDWILYAPYSDKTLMRNMLTYQYALNMGQYAPRTQPIELVINGEYRGLYVLIERIKRDQNRVDIAKLTEEDIEGDELTGGYLMQIDRDAPDIYDGWYSNHTPFNFFAFNDPKWDEIHPIQANYIRNYMNGFENAMAASNYADAYDNLIDEDAFIDYVLANEIPKHIDAYRLSFFMHKKKDSNGGKIHLGPIWDINLGYGNFDYGCDNSPSGWSYDWGIGGPNCAPITFWVPKIAKIPAVQDKMKCRWEELREGVLSTQTLHNYIDSMALVLQAAQGRNFQRWPVLGEYVWPNDYIGTTYQSEINNLKSWVTIRLNWMDNNMEGECIIDDVESLSSNFHLQVFPNPFQNEVRFLVKNSDFQKGTIRVLDVLGRVVLEKGIIGNETLVLENGGLENGVYFYEFWVEDQLIKSDILAKSVF